MSEEEQKPYAEAEMREGYSGPAITANRFLVSVGAGGVRLMFLEQSVATGAPHFRSAVMLSLSDAEALADVLADTIARHHAAAGGGNAEPAI